MVRVEILGILMQSCWAWNGKPSLPWALYGNSTFIRMVTHVLAPFGLGP